MLDEEGECSLMVLRQKPDDEKTEKELLRELILIVEEGTKRFGMPRRRKEMHDDPTTIKD